MNAQRIVSIWVISTCLLISNGSLYALAPSSSSFLKENSRRLYSVWLKGATYYNELIYEARKQGYEGLWIEDYHDRPFRGNSEPLYSPPADYYLAKHLYEIYWNGVKGNVHQHAGGKGVYLWRETLDGYEFMMFDWGPGALNRQGRLQEELGEIFDAKSYREKGPGPDGEYHGGGEGVGLMFVGSDTYLTRIVSVNNGSAKVVEKEPGFRRPWSGHIPTNQEKFEMPEGYEKATGFFVHGFVPIVTENYQGRFSPISNDDILGTVETITATPVQRGSWQVPHANGLERLRPGDDVEVVYYKTAEKEVIIEKEVRLVALPSFQSGPKFAISDGTTINNNDITEIISTAGLVKVTDYMTDIFRTFDWRGLKPGDQVKVKYKTTVAIDERTQHRGILSEIASPVNEGVFIFVDGLEISYARIKEFRIYGNLPIKPEVAVQDNIVTADILDMSKTQAGEMFDHLMLSNIGFISEIKPWFKKTEILESIRINHSTDPIHAVLDKPDKGFAFFFYSNDDYLIAFSFNESQIPLRIEHDPERRFVHYDYTLIPQADFVGFRIEGNEEQFTVRLQLARLTDKLKLQLQRHQAPFTSKGGHKLIIEEVISFQLPIEGQFL